MKIGCAADSWPTQTSGVRLSSLSIVLPAHNERDNIESMVREAARFGPIVADRHEIIIVDDGSADGTGELAQKLALEIPSLRVVHNPQNRGYGGALKAGFVAAEGDWVFFTDADRQFRLDRLPEFAARSRQADLVIGYRLRRSDPPHRLLNAWLYKHLIRLLFGLRVRDVDCAYKLIRRSLLRSLDLESEGALISAEMLVKANRAGCRAEEVGVHHYPRQAGKQSGARIGVILRMFRELFALRRRILSFTPLAVAAAEERDLEKAA